MEDRHPARSEVELTRSIKKKDPFQDLKSDIRLYEARIPGGLTESRGSFVGRCPLHEDRTPSFHIDNLPAKEMRHYSQRC
jgi:DNA primase